MSKLTTGLVFTNENCVGCNKCIGVCSCHGATVAKISNEGKNIIVVDESKCVACGACFDACEHNAREYVDDTVTFFDDLKRGEDISVLVAPAFFANYPDEARDILGRLKALGVNRIISVGFGADITTWAYLNYISKNDFTGAISQPCPAAVDYIEKYIPELIPKLIPVQSPMMCAAIYARKKMGLTGKLAFISPCIAKKNEIISERGKGLVSYNVTFNHMMKYLRHQNCEAVPFNDELECGLGSIYPQTGGLKENIYWFMGEETFVRQIDGERRMYEYLMEHKSRILEKDSPYTMLDVLNCSDGCLCGTGVESDRISKEDVLLQMMRIKKESRNREKNDAWQVKLSPSERFAELNKQFSELELEDYLCSYTDKSDGEVWKNPSEEELDAIFDDMNKSTDEERVINCSSCGYNSCKDMARAIYNGYNHKENCVHFLKDVLSGISADFPTVLLIHGRRQTVHVVKYSGEDAIRSWIDSGLSLVDYNTAILDYIERYVDDADKKRVWQNVEFSALLKNMEENNRYAITYYRHPEIGEPGFFELNFTREKGLNDIILSFKDVNKAVVEQQEHHRALKNALDKAEKNNEIIGSISDIYEALYSINLKTDKYTQIKTNDFVSAFVNKFTSASACLKELPVAMYKAENFSELQEFYDYDSWRDRFREKDSVYLDAKGRIHGWLRTSLIVSKRDENGEVEVVLLSIQDIYDEKEKEFESYSIINGLSIEYSTLWMISVKTETIRLIRNSNRATLEGMNDNRNESIEYSKAICHYIDTLIVEEDRERVRGLIDLDSLNKNIPEDGIYTINFLKKYDENENRYTQMVFTKTIDGNGNNNIVLAFRDIDEIIREEQEKEKILENALRDAEQANITKSTFLANMSHEIRTPINAILGMDTMILRESNQESVIEYARNVKSASDTLLSLINDILDFSKIESGKMEIIEGNYRLDSVINDLMNMVGSKAEEKGLFLELRMDDNIPAQLYGDEVRIKQIALNLLNNAVKYTKEGKVTLKFAYRQIEKDEIILEISVKDTGIGIRQEDMKILFSPYERLEENKNKLIEGTGLGLSITKNLLEKMNSSLNVESVYGEGSEFSFNLRQKMWGPDRISESSIYTNDSIIAEEECEAFHAPDAKILVVDDVEMNIMVVVNLLKRLHIKPDSCLSGREALDLASLRKYDMIFLDAMMPGMSGEETLEGIRKDCTLNAETPIIVLTANAIIGAREQYIEEGFNDYLSKPIDGPKLEKLIHDYLPPDKIIDISDNVDDELGPVSTEDKEVFEAIGKSGVISAQNGMQAAGDVATYVSICKNFLDTSSARIEMIRDFYDKRDAANYTIQVHALKSSARLVGATDLSEMALELELAGRAKNWEKIDAQTSILLGKYKEITGILAVAFIKSDEGKEKKELSSKKFDRRMGELLELVEAFDFESAKSLFYEFEEYLIPEDRIKIYCELKALIADVNRDEIINVIDKQLGR